MKIFDPEDGLPTRIQYFLDEFFPKITKEESDFIGRVINWDQETKTAFNISKTIFEKEVKKTSRKKKKYEE